MDSGRSGRGKAALYASPSSACLPKRAQRVGSGQLAVHARPEGLALRFLDKNLDWCTSPEKNGIEVCKEILEQDGWRGSTKANCQAQLQSLARDVKERQEWHDEQAAPQLRAQRAHGPIECKPLHEWHAPKGRGKRAHNAGAAVRVIVRRVIVEERVEHVHMP